MEPVVGRDDHEPGLRKQVEIDDGQVVEATEVPRATSVIDDCRPSPPFRVSWAHEQAIDVGCATDVPDVQHLERRLRSSFFVLSRLKVPSPEFVQRLVERQRRARPGAQDLSVTAHLPDAESQGQGEHGRVAGRPDPAAWKYGILQEQDVDSLRLKK
jgi:hypothetical protein